MKIGFAGMGRMGTAMALHLLELGHDVTVWNRSTDKLKPLTDAGAKTVPTPGALVEGNEVIVSSLLDGAALRAVYEGDGGILAARPDGLLVVEMSTVLSKEAVALAEKVRAAGAAFVECPVGGTTGPARTGKLLGLAGGTDADFARAKPLLDQLCRRVEHVGPVGAGAAMKLAINLPLLVYYQALGEAYALCGKVGLDTKWLVDFFTDTSGGMNVLKMRADPIAVALAGGDTGAAAFSVDGIRKDLRTMIAEAGEMGIDLPVTAATLGVYDEASARGLGEKDGSMLAGYWPNKARD
ncbi:NAD(P)-dependent oxidoreductase [Aquabacter spiritensis]|uniref:3-hydroxyisobutyrate dehydrogenase n=1 Tax=Aquabacter spiritensis TaxID=933073 RepID=A0A4R3LZ35_9HYPH|nr:NAD(P)-dependent oxidoreductase [Aquabacter spiritensis]TCT05970.1 3-hydroxyisobutyrate dehydrogenase [Aquabacter spiritensis]